jgi:peptidoglycan/LPS O-acetylase OafA/YrhL
MFQAYRAVCARGRTIPMPSLLEAASVALAVVVVVVGRDGSAVTMLAPLAFAAVVFVFSFEAGRLSRLLRMRGFIWLGDRSYTVYMVHSFVADSIVRVLLFLAAVTPIHALAVGSGPTASGFVASFGNPYVTDLFMAFYVLAVLACAEAVHRTVERPARAWFNRLAAAYLARRATVPAAAAT